jgi:biliverdin reductase
MLRLVDMDQVRVGIVGTGYAAKIRAENLMADPRSHLSAVAGHRPDATTAFAQTYGATALDSWLELVHRPDVDLVMIATINRDHGAIAQAALEAGKHVVVEYPLALDATEANTLAHLAAQRQRLLHVEHIDMLSGVHQLLTHHLPRIGTPVAIRYSSLAPKRPAPQKWTYQLDGFGFPFMGAVSRIHRLTSLFGTVVRVSGQARFWYGDTWEPLADALRHPQDYFTTCHCVAQLEFANGAIAEVSYAKGETIWQSERCFEAQGTKGMIRFQGTEGILVTDQGTQSLDAGSRRGLFAKDTAQVLDSLFQGTSLYVTLQSSLYALTVADAIRQATMTGVTLVLPL